MRSIGNVQLDYKFHFFPELRANLNLGYDVSEGKGDVVVEKWSPDKFTQGGERSRYEQDKRNLLMEFYLNYTKEFANRSEEHTSELQSRGHLVCRLQLEKKEPI